MTSLPGNSKSGCPNITIKEKDANDILHRILLMIKSIVWRCAEGPVKTQSPNSSSTHYLAIDNLFAISSFFRLRYIVIIVAAGPTINRE